MIRWIILVAGLLGGVGVGIGAFAAHGLEKNLAEQSLAPEEIANRLEQCETAVKYHMTHVLALLTLGLHNSSLRRKRRSAAAVFLLLGLALFSGGLYSMVFLGEMGHWAIVPSGGLCFLIGWAWIASLAFGSQDAGAGGTSKAVQS